MVFSLGVAFAMPVMSPSARVISGGRGGGVGWGGGGSPLVVPLSALHLCCDWMKS